MVSAVLTFPAKGLGSGTQVVSGVTDRNGNPFTPKLFLFHGNSTLGSIQSVTPTPAGIVSLYWLSSEGTADITGGFNRGACMATSTRFGLKLANQGLGPGAALSEIPDVFFGGFVVRGATVSAVAEGSFTLDYSFNDYTGDDISVTVLGGSDLEYYFSFFNSLSSLSTPIAPKGLMIRNAGLSSYASGNAGFSFGDTWAAASSEQGVAVATVLPTALGAGNSRYLSSTQLTSGGFAVSSFNASSISFNSAWTDGLAVVFGGSGITCTAGHATLGTTVGTTIIDLGIAASCVFFSTVGAPASGSVDTTKAEICRGSYDGTRQASIWAAESSTSTTPNGARFLSNTHIMQFGTPAGVGSSITASVAATQLNGQYLTISRGVVDGTARVFNWFAIGPDTSLPSDTPIDGCVSTLPN